MCVCSEEGKTEVHSPPLSVTDIQIIPNLNSESVLAST